MFENDPRFQAAIRVGCAGCIKVRNTESRVCTKLEIADGLPDSTQARLSASQLTAWWKNWFSGVSEGFRLKVS